jgi:hypothetical protein
MVASQPYQAYHHPNQSTPAPPTVGTPSSLPKRPTPAPTPTKPATNAPLALDDTSGVSTIFVAPELRDFKKEATAFVPRGIRQKAQAATIGPRVNAAPISAGGASPDARDDDGGEELQRPDLMKTLAKAGITGTGASGSATANAAAHVEKEPPKTIGNQEQQDEYERFMDDIGDLLK